MSTSDNENGELLRTALQNSAVVLQERERFERALLLTRDELRESNELLRKVFDQAPIGIAMAGLDGTLLDANPKFEQLLGYAVSDLRTKTFLELTHPDDVAATASNVEALFAGAIPEYQMEKRYLRQDGAVLWSRTTVTFLRDARGEPTRFIAAIEDVTERRMAEDALRDESRTLDLLNTTGMLLSSTLDREVLLQSITDAATKVTGASFGAYFYTAVSPESGETFMLYSLSGAPKAAFARFGHPRTTPIFGPTFRGEPPIRSDDILSDARYGQWAPHHGMPTGHLPVRSYLAVPVVARSGEVMGGLFFGHPDIGVFTERSERLAVGIAAQAAIALDNARLYENLSTAAKQREELLEAERAARSEAERVSRLKDDFLATLSHELRTPLTAILGWAQVLLSGKAKPDEQTRGIESIARNARAQAQLIEDLLDMNRIVSGKVRLDVQPMELVGVIQNAIDSLRPAADAREIRLRTIIDPQAGPVMGDPHRLQQVVWNLLSNATKFTPKGGAVTVSLAQVNSHVEVVVCDTGMGISPEFLPHVFDRFRQADGSTTRQFGGLGLGLALVKSLVELHGGKVRAHSEGENMGAEFTVALPRVSVKPTTVARDQPRTSLGTFPIFENVELDLAGKRILLVDDEPDALELLEQLLGQYGATIEKAPDAMAALALVSANPPDLLISDIGMPGMDGYQLIRAVRALPESQGKRTPAIAVTAFARSQDRVQAMIAGYQLHVAKPIEAPELLASVGSLLGAKL